METNKLPTAEEFMYQNDILNPSRKITQTMIEFAKLHVKQALKSAAENAEGYYYDEEGQKIDSFTSEQSILNSYPDDNIK